MHYFDSPVLNRTQNLEVKREREKRTWSLRHKTQDWRQVFFPFSFLGWLQEKRSREEIFVQQNVKIRRTNHRRSTSKTSIEVANHYNAPTEPLAMSKNSEETDKVDPALLNVNGLLDPSLNTNQTSQPSSAPVGWANPIPCVRSLKPARSQLLQMLHVQKPR